MRVQIKICPKLKARLDVFKKLPHIKSYNDAIDYLEKKHWEKKRINN